MVEFKLHISSEPPVIYWTTLLADLGRPWLLETSNILMNNSKNLLSFLIYFIRDLQIILCRFDRYRWPCFMSYQFFKSCMLNRSEKDYKYLYYYLFIQQLHSFIPSLTFQPCYTNHHFRFKPQEVRFTFLQYSPCVPLSLQLSQLPLP